MKIELMRVKIRDLVKGFNQSQDDSEVVAYANDEGKPRLNIRPKYQREFVYKDKQQEAVIDTIMKGFPLNSIYWVKHTGDDIEFEYEILDGQQRTISICKFHNGEFSYQGNYYHNLVEDIQNKFLDYELMIYVCEGEDSEKLDWFRVINIAGEKLTEQELRNINYTSQWLTDAKKKFSKRNCNAEMKAKRYIKDDPIRQELLERAIAWKVGKWDDKAICEYMGQKAKDSKHANELWLYFSSVIEWVESNFNVYRKEMQGLDWGFFYNKYKDSSLDPDELEAKISMLIQNTEVQKKRGIYEYILSGDERSLNLRAFDDDIKTAVYERQNKKCKGNVEGFQCPHKDEELDISQMQADHIIPWSRGGKTVIENCQMLCRECNNKKRDRM